MGEYNAAYYQAWYNKAKVELKRAAIDAYGGKCACCGESNLAFLTIEHRNNDGAEYRRSLGNRSRGGIHTYRDLKKHGYPQDEGLEVACWNCNAGRQVNGGVCPHQIKQWITTPPEFIALPPNTIVWSPGQSDLDLRCNTHPNQLDWWTRIALPVMVMGEVPKQEWMKNDG